MTTPNDTHTIVDKATAFALLTEVESHVSHLISLHTQLASALGLVATVKKSHKKKNKGGRPPGSKTKPAEIVAPVVPGFGT